MHRFSVALIVVVAVVLAGQRTPAQTLTVSLLERYLESLREQAGIPGMSALVLQGPAVLWARGFGRADLESVVPASADTPYLIGGLSQTIGATLLLRKCIDQGSADYNDPVAEWVPGFPEPDTRLRHLLGHMAPSGAFNPDLTRFDFLTPVIEKCAGLPYQQVLSEEILSRLGMLRSVPGTALATPTADDVELFGEPNLVRYRALLHETAKPYRVDGRGRATRTDVPPARASAAGGLVSTVYDLARFEATLDESWWRDGVLLDQTTLHRAWRPAAPPFPAGLGWFVQTYQNELIVWQFGQIKDAYSSLVVKVPNRGLTFILLANSDALGAPFGSAPWDVTASVFARVFLRIFVP